MLTPDQRLARAGAPHPGGDLAALEVLARTCLCLHALLPHLSGLDTPCVLSLAEADSRDWLRRNDLPLRGVA